ncbi:hypothetical protein MasN3_07900 [Massilia varians]|uniref:Uncharacterized protein n=1 Tax=Massilia varians TaxID=457921 RepID=A0ABM8C2B0_9BURK|nr:hypothetical protein MasN3_07900 [Massilia varians]
MDNKIVAFAYVRQHVQPSMAVGVLMINWLVSVASRRDVVERVGEFESERSCHAEHLTGRAMSGAEMAQRSAGWRANA